MARIIYNVEDKPKARELVVFSFQQLLSIIAATIAVPVLIGAGDHMSAALLGAGVGTLIYVLCTKAKSPVILSSSFAFIGALTMALSGYGYLGIILGGIFAGLVYVILSLVIHFAGTKWIDKIMPPVVIGPVVACIGLSLAGSAISNLLSADGYISPDGVHPYNLLALLCGLVTFFLIMAFSLQERWKHLRMIPFLIGMGGGYLLAAIFSSIGYGLDIPYLKIIDFNPIIARFSPISITSFFDYPRFALIEGINEIVNNKVAINGLGVAEIALAFVPVALVTFAEHIADHKNLGSIIGRDLVGDKPGLAATLLGDGIGSIGGTIFGICPNTTYGESIGTTAISGNASIRTIIFTALMCIALSFLSPLTSALQTIPTSVLGGACLALYGFIAASGLKMLKGIDVSEGKNLFTVSIIFVIALGGASLQIPYAFGYVPDSDFRTVTRFISIGSIAFGLILGILVYWFGGLFEKKKA